MNDENQLGDNDSKSIQEALEALIICAKKIPSNQKYNGLFKNILDCIRELQWETLRRRN